MSEFPDQGAAPGLAAGGGSAGALIRRAREDAGMHIAALAVALKVPVKRLEALEADRHDLLPDAVFARALAGSICRHLKIDPGPILSLLPQGQSQPLTVEGRINEPFRAVSPGQLGWASRISPAAVMAAVLLVLAALAVYLVPHWSDGGTARPSAAPAAPPAMPPASGEPAPAQAPGTVVEAVPAAPAPASPPAASPVR